MTYFGFGVESFCNWNHLKVRLLSTLNSLISFGSWALIFLDISDSGSVRFHSKKAENQFLSACTYLSVLEARLILICNKMELYSLQFFKTNVKKVIISHMNIPY